MNFCAIAFYWTLSEMSSLKMIQRAGSTIASFFFVVDMTFSAI